MLLFEVSPHIVRLEHLLVTNVTGYRGQQVKVVREDLAARPDRLQQVLVLVDRLHLDVDQVLGVFLYLTLDSVGGRHFSVVENSGQFRITSVGQVLGGQAGVRELGYL